MNRELMEKIAKRKEDPNYPYGNKLGKGHAIGKGAAAAITSPLAGAALGTGIGAQIGLPIGLMSGGHPIKGMKYGGIAGATIGGTLGVISAPRDGKEGYISGTKDRHLSYLPSNEQKALKKESRRLVDAKEVLYKKMEKDNYPYDWEEEDLPYIHKDYRILQDIEKQENKLWTDAYARGKALMLAEKKNRRLFKKASDYLDEAVMEKEAKTRAQKMVDAGEIKDKKL